MKRFKAEVKQIVALPNNKLLFQIVGGREQILEWEYEPRSNSWTEKMKDEARAHYLKRGKGGNS